MKKFLALFLVLVMAFSCVLVSCGNKNNNNDADNTDDDDDIVGIGTQPTGTTTSGNNGNGGSTSLTWTDDANGTMIYIQVQSLRVRTEPNPALEYALYEAKFNESYKRIKYNDEWTLIDYKGKEMYVATKYITTDKGYTAFTKDAEETTVYVSAYSINLRSSTCTIDDSNVKTNKNKGDELIRVATSENGKWIIVRCTYTPAGENQTPVTEELYCFAGNVSTTKDGTTTQTPDSVG